MSYVDYLLKKLKDNDPTTKIIDLNTIDVICVIQIANAMKENIFIQKLTLRWNNFDHNGLLAIANSLKVNKSLQALDLSLNNIGDDGAKELANALKENFTSKT